MLCCFGTFKLDDLLSMSSRSTPWNLKLVSYGSSSLHTYVRGSLLASSFNTIVKFWANRDEVVVDEFGNFNRFLNMLTFMNH